MSKVMIIGAGGVGGVVTHKCAQLVDVFDEIILASRTESKCKKIAEQLTRSIRTAQVDADNVEELTELLNKEKPSLVINVALPYQDLHIMDACLNARVHYLDTANYEPPNEAKFEYSWQWAYQDKFEQAGLMALLGSGFDPGVTNVYTAYIKKHCLDQIHELDIIDCNAGDHGQPFATNFNPEINIREVTAKGRYWHNGEWIETAPLSEKDTFDFPEGIGPKDIYLMYHEELESITKHYPEIKRARFWMTFSKNYLNHLEVLQNIGMTGIEPVNHNGVEIVPLQFLKSVLPDPSSLGPLTKGRTCIGCVAKGLKDGQEKNRLPLQYMRSRGMLQRGPIPSYFLHHWRASNDWRKNDAGGQMDAKRCLEYGTVRSRPLYARPKSIRLPWTLIEMNTTGLNPRLLTRYVT